MNTQHIRSVSTLTGNCSTFMIYIFFLVNQQFLIFHQKLYDRLDQGDKSCSGSEAMYNNMMRAAALFV